MSEAIFVEGLTKTYAGKTVVDFWHNPADWSYAWRCRTLITILAVCFFRWE